MTTSNGSEVHLERLRVRRWQPDDDAAVARLYTDGLLSGQLDPNDTGADIENIADAYFTDGPSHFWVADCDGQVLGTVGVVRDELHVAEIRRLRVQREFQQSCVPVRLIEQAIQHCRAHAFLKVVLDTRFEHNSAVDLFQRLGFQFTRSRSRHGKELMEFYLDLYRPHRIQE